MNQRRWFAPAALLLAGVCAAGAMAQDVTVTRLLDEPIIGPDLHPSLGVNIQGPSVIQVPDWAPNRMGRYYIYFADHKGLYIRLAYADELTGPWRVHEPGSMQIADSYFLPERPVLPQAELDALVERRRATGVPVSHDIALELTQPHIASPDVHVDEENRRFIMYFHGLEAAAMQHSRVATSADGINFTTLPDNIGRTYMRAFEHEGMTYAMSMPGQFYRSADGLTDFEEGPLLFVPNMRHSALLPRGDTLHVFWSRVGDAPETILYSTIDISGDWSTWRESPEVEVLRPEFDWEGADAPVEPSVRSTAYGHVNQLRDPAFYVEGEDIYLFYAVAGESGIAIAKVEFH